MGKVPEMNTREVKIIKKREEPKDPRTRSEYTLLFELMARNPDKVKEFVQRLKIHLA
jgi:hypothetical protein